MPAGAIIPENRAFDKLEMVTRMYRRELLRRLILVSVLGVLIGFTVTNFTPLYWLSARVTDGLLRQFRHTFHPDLLLVVIDDESLQTLGRFPFDRTVYARLLDKLKKAGAKVAVFDILFVEPTPSDGKFAEAIRKFGKVILGVSPSFKTESKIAEKFLLPLEFNLPMEITGVILPPEQLLSVCSGLGLVYPFPDRDGVCRTLPLAVRLGDSGKAFPSLGLAAAIAWAGKPEFSPNSICWKGLPIHLGDDWDIVVLPPFSPERVGFKAISLVRILQGNFDPQLVRGKLVLIGMAASGLSDRLPTSTDPLAYGVEIHAAAINSLLSGNSPLFAPFWLQILFALTFCVLVSLTVLFHRFYFSVAGFITLIFAAYILSLFSLRLGLIFPPMPVFLSVAITYVTSIGSLFEFQWGALKQVQAYLARPIAETLLSSPERLRSGERREITVLFSDIRNFTQVATTLSPYEVVALLESYFNLMTDIVRLYGGTVDKFLGDGMMVLFGVNPDQTDHARRAVLCALQMLEELSSISWEWERVTGSPLRIGIGINTGTAVIGEIGAEWRKELTALGANVNLAQRLEQLTKELGANLLISENTYRKVEGLVVAEPLEPLTVKGFDYPIIAYKVTGLTELGKRVRKSILAARV